MDGDEEFQLQAGDNPGEVVVVYQNRPGALPEEVQVTFSNVKRVVADLGAGNDVFDVNENLTTPVIVTGGAGRR